MENRKQNDFSLAYYRRLWAAVTIAPENREAVRAAVKRILKNRRRYEKVEALTGIPWWFIAALHERESTCNFKKHLHNGDPLHRPTVNEPSGRPACKTWEESALDALRIKKFHKRTRWTIADGLYRAEYRWNGDGYGKYGSKGRPIHSPFLVAHTTEDLYEGGKYASDGNYDRDLKDKQVGCAAIWRDMVETGTVDLGAVVARTSSQIVFRRRRPRDKWLIDAVKRHQVFLNTVYDAELVVDGWAGRRTSTAHFEAFGHYLVGDDREKA